MPKLTTVFAGSPVFAATILDRLVNSKYAPVAVLTQPDRPKGRGRRTQANAVKNFATKADIKVHQPPNLRDPAAVELLAQYQPDLLIVAAYGLILPPTVLRIPKFGCINVHASLLPRWRGAAPVERAIMAGDPQTGVCIMEMAEGLDTGPVYAQQEIPLTDQSNAHEVENQLAELGAELLLRTVKKFAKAARDDNLALPTPLAQNNELATYAEKLTPRDRHIDWQKSATAIARQINALAQRMPVRTIIGDCGVQLLAARCIEQTLRPDPNIAPGTLLDASKSGLAVQCATDMLQITSIKVERGKGKAMDAAAAINGFKQLFVVGKRFTDVT